MIVKRKIQGEKRLGDARNGNCDCYGKSKHNREENIGSYAAALPKAVVVNLQVKSHAHITEASAGPP